MEVLNDVTNVTTGGVNYKDCVGKVYQSNSSGDFKIVKYSF